MTPCLMCREPKPQERHSVGVDYVCGTCTIKIMDMEIETRVEALRRAIGRDSQDHVRALTMFIPKGYMRQMAKSA